jgi:hypothetical protein
MIDFQLENRYAGLKYLADALCRQRAFKILCKSIKYKNRMSGFLVCFFAKNAKNDCRTVFFAKSGG